MIPALYILLAIVVVGVILKLTDRPAAPDRNTDDAGIDVPDDSSDQGCCGMHITCERDSLSTAVATEADYYDDEDLDVYRGRAADEYTDSEIEQFRDVLLTLLPDDIAPWARSVQLRGITLPAEVREELLMIVAEARSARSAATSAT